MFKVVDRNGRELYCSFYSFMGDNILLDGTRIISGSPSTFTITDLDAPLDTVDPTQWLIDVGPFFDRFGPAKLSVLSFQDPTVKAIVQDVMVRKWVDLKNPSVAGGIDALIALGVPGVDNSIKEAIINTPVSEEEKQALKKLYFS